MSSDFGGLPVLLDAHMPQDELWLVIRGEKRVLHVHEGPQTGEDVEVWLRKPRIVRIVNLGKDQQSKRELSRD